MDLRPASGKDTKAQWMVVEDGRVAAASLGNENKIIKGVNQKDARIEPDDKTLVCERMKG